MWNPFSKLKRLVIRKGTEAAVKPLETKIGGIVAEQKARPLKGWRTILVNGGIVALAAFLHFVADLDFEDLGLNATMATVIVAAINAVLRGLTTTPLGKGK